MKQFIQNPFTKSIIGGLLLSLAWWEHFSGLIMLVAFVPFLSILSSAKNINLSGSRVFTQLIPGFLAFNLITFSWLANASVAGASLAIIAHTFLMSFTLWLVYQVSLKASNITTALSFLSLWSGYEYACLKINLISPWLNTGNVFGKEPGLVQWYEYTGAGGGTLWILLTNLLFFRFLILLFEKNGRYVSAILPLVITIASPIIISQIIDKSFVEDGVPEKVVIVQPNIDPFTDKFGNLPFTTQLDDMLSLAESVIDNESRWVILPETAIDDPFYESAAQTNRYVKRVKDFIAVHDSINIIFGATTTQLYFDATGQKRSSVQEIQGSQTKYELFNSAVHVGNKSDISFYHKSKLVPGIERKVNILPSFLERIIIPELGGTMSGYGTQKTREIFTHSTTGTRVAPVICYESAFGEYTTQYIHKGADFIAIITNDGWWKNTAGYKQHLWFASLRAIETRRYVVRSANTGISCFIDKRGRIFDSLPWWKRGVISAYIYPASEITAYASHGDLIYRYFTVTGIIILVLAFVAAPLRKSKKMQPFK